MPFRMLLAITIYKALFIINIWKLFAFPASPQTTVFSKIIFFFGFLENAIFEICDHLLSAKLTW